MMKRIYCAVAETLVSLAVFSCGDPLYMGMPYVGETGGMTEGPALPDEKKSLYVTGIEYPDGYDWLPELGGGSVEAVMFLMKDGERIVEIKVGAKYQVSADADMHRNIGDHLYTDYSTDEETVIKKDGVELFRYPDREMIHSMLVEGDDVYTLGIPRSGSGFTYRKNGEILIVKGSAKILSGLHKDEGHIIFSYENIIESYGNTTYKYYYAVDGEVRSLEVTPDIVRVDDIRIIDGTLHYVAAFSDDSYRVHYSGNETFLLKRILYTAYHGSAILYAGGKVFVKCMGKFNSGDHYPIFWCGTSLVSYIQGVSAFDWCVDKENVYHVTGRKQSNTSLTLMKNDDFWNLPQYYKWLHSGCIAAHDGKCAVVLVDSENSNSPVLWIDEAVTVYDFNGLFTSVSYQ